MHRFINLKTLHTKNVNLSPGPKEVQCIRTCTLCNTISVCSPFTGKASLSRLHSTSANPVRAVYRVVAKKKDRFAGAVLSRTEIGSYSKSKRKMRITVLDSSDTIRNEADQQQYLTSSSMSPAFVGSRMSKIGVTVMLPPTSSSRTVKKNLDLESSAPECSSSINKPSPEQVKALSDAAADLLLSGLSRNRFLVEDMYHETKCNEPSPEPVLFSTVLQQIIEEGIHSVSHESISKESDSNLEINSKEESAHQLVKDNKEEDCQQGNCCNGNADSHPGKEDTKHSAAKGKKSKKRQAKDHLRTIAARSIAAKRKIVLRRAAYIDVCVNTGRMQHATEYAVAGLRSLTDCPDRNTLLEPLFLNAVRDEKLMTVLHLISIAKTHEVKLTLESYVLSFDLLARLPKTEANVNISEVLFENMKAEGVSVQDLLEHCKGRNVVIQRVLSTINSIDHKIHNRSSSDYTIDVLLPLNDTNQAKSRKYQSPAKGLLSEECAESLVDEQIKAHDSCIFKIRNIACQMDEAEISALLQKQKEVENEWRASIAEGFLSSLKATKIDNGSFQMPVFLECLPVETFVDIVIQEVHARLDDSDKQSIGFTVAERLLGKRVKELYDKHVLSKFGLLESARNAHVNYCKWYADPENFPQGPSNPRQIWDSVILKMGYDDTITSCCLQEWPGEMYSKIGKFLYKILLRDVKINENIESTTKAPHMVPALYVVFRKTTRGYQRQMKMHPAVHHIFPTKMQPFLTMSPYELPMTCPPRPWVSHVNGVYPLGTPDLQRTPGTSLGEDALKESLESVPTQQLYACLDSLNQLGSVPWKINKPVLDVVTEVFNSGGSKELDIPFPPTATLPEPSIPSNAPLAQRIAISKERATIRQENAATYSLWCDTLYKLSIAHEVRDRLFWLPHNMDFRGRVYPVCPHLQHMSNDMSRSLLVFAKGEKLGPDGLDWLKLHLINLIGNMNKESLDARLAYANEAIPKILDSADKPLTGDKWWIDSEYPWQTLAACKEIASAIASGDPENFVSHFPIHQDGSCNGLQHYAALGRDTLGAKSVNLVDTEKPSDVYMCVANGVEQQRAKDAANGNELAQSLEGFITRKVVKQTVMTTVYGVTVFGANLQIRGRLKDLEFPMDKIPQASAYLARLVFQSLGEMFTSSRNIQDWLTQCASGIVKSKSMPVRWVTPLGLPVIQPYLKKLTLKQSVRLSDDLISRYALSRLPACQKHRNAFSPNFIHSLDSCHMILTSLYCEQANITFVSVHDCYWVHPKNVPAMNKICREQFVALHSKPILEDLSDFFHKTYTSEVSGDSVEAVEERRLKRLFSAVPPKGNFDLREVLKSKYFFS